MQSKFKNKIGKLRVSANQRYLEYDDGTPFFTSAIRPGYCFIA